MKLIALPLVLAILAPLSCGDNLTYPPDRDPYLPLALKPLECVPNLDGIIDHTELSAAIGVQIAYLVSPDGEQRPVDLVGQVGPAGKRVWDWGADYATDKLARLAASDLSGKWYASSFPSGSFVAPFDPGGRVEAIYAHSQAGIDLLGLASAVENPAEGQTLLTYLQPVRVYRFPLQLGDEWLAVGEIRDGMLRGLPYAGRDVYEIAVDGSGELVLPDLTFTQVLRVRTRTVIEPAVGVPVSQRQVSFLFECFGEVARATSLTDEPEEDFSSALEVRRLGI